MPSVLGRSGSKLILQERTSLNEDHSFLKDSHVQVM